MKKVFHCLKNQEERNENNKERKRKLPCQKFFFLVNALSIFLIIIGRYCIDIKQLKCETRLMHDHLGFYL